MSCCGVGVELPEMADWNEEEWRADADGQVKIKIRHLCQNHA